MSTLACLGMACPPLAAPGANVCSMFSLPPLSARLFVLGMLLAFRCLLFHINRVRKHRSQFLPIYIVYYLQVVNVHSDFRAEIVFQTQ